MLVGSGSMLINSILRTQIIDVFCAIRFEHISLIIAILAFVYLIISFMVNTAFNINMKSKIKDFDKIKQESRDMSEYYKERTAFNYIIIQYFLVNLVNNQKNEDDVAKDIYNLMKTKALNVEQFRLIELLNKEGIKESLTSKISYLINQDRLKNNISGEIK